MSKLLKVKLVNIKDVSLLVGSISLKIGAVAILGRAVEVIISLNKLHKLLLNVGQLAFRELVFIGLDF